MFLKLGIIQYNSNDMCWLLFDYQGTSQGPPVAPRLHFAQVCSRQWPVSCRAVTRDIHWQTANHCDIALLWHEVILESFSNSIGSSGTQRGPGSTCRLHPERNPQSPVWKAGTQLSPIMRIIILPVDQLLLLGFYLNCFLDDVWPECALHKNQNSKDCGPTLTDWI